MYPVSSMKLTAPTCQEAIPKGNETSLSVSIFRCYVSLTMVIVKGPLRFRVGVVGPPWKWLKWWRIDGGVSKQETLEMIQMAQKYHVDSQPWYFDYTFGPQNFGPQNLEQR